MTICSHVCAVTLIGIGNLVQEIGVALNLAALTLQLSNRIFVDVMDWQVCYCIVLHLYTVYNNHDVGSMRTFAFTSLIKL